MADVTLTKGDILVIDHETLNRGDISDTQDITLDAGSTTKATQADVTLDPDEQTGGTLTWDTAGETAKTYDVCVTTDDREACLTVEVQSGATVPSSAIHRWKLDDVGSGTATDSIGSADGTVNGVSNVSGTYQGGSAGDGDGSNDIITARPVTWLSNLDTDHAIGFTVDFDSLPDRANFPHRFGIVSETSGGVGMANTIGFSPDNTGEVYYFIEGENGNRSSFTSNTTLSTGKTRVLINAETSDVSNWDIYFNNSAQATTVTNNQTLTAGVQASDDEGNPVDWGMFGRDTFYTGLEGFIPGIFDDVILYNDSLSGFEIADDYNIQPWS